MPPQAFRLKAPSSSPAAAGDARLLQGLFHLVHRLAAPNELAVHDERRHTEDPGAGRIGAVLIDDGLERPGLDRLIHLRDVEPHLLGDAIQDQRVSDVHMLPVAWPPEGL